MKKIYKVLLFILIGVAALFAVMLVVAAIAPSKYAVDKSVTVNKSKQEVFEYVKLLKNQDDFSAWSKMDPNMKKTFKGEDGEVGFVSAWESLDPNVGKGEQEIMGIKEGERIDYEFRFIEPFEATDDAFMTFKSVSDSETKVTWGFKGKMDYPMNIMLLFMSMEEMLGSQLQEGLDNLKTILEK